MFGSMLASLILAACAHGSGGGGGEATVAKDNDDGDGAASSIRPYPVSRLVNAIDNAKAALAGIDADLANAKRAVDGPASLDPRSVDSLIALTAERRVRAGRVHVLERCLASTTGLECPPSLAITNVIPPVDDDSADLTRASSLDATSWIELARTFHVAACGCASQACVDGYTESIRRTEDAVPTALRADEASSADIAEARRCLWSLSGRGQDPTL